MVEGLVIRPAKYEDAEQILALRKRVDKAEDNDNPPLDWYGWGHPDLADQQREMGQYKRTIFNLAILDGEIVGLANSFEMASLWGLVGTPGLFRLNFIVDLPVRGKGIGTQLAGSVVEWAKAKSKVKVMICDFGTSHKSARHILEKFGFTVVHERYEMYMVGYRYHETEMILTLRQDQKSG